MTKEQTIEQLISEYGHGNPPWNWTFVGDPHVLLEKAYDAGCAAQAQKAPELMVSCFGEIHEKCPDCRAANCTPYEAVSTGPQEKEKP